MNHWHTGNKKLECGGTISNRDRTVLPACNFALIAPNQLMPTGGQGLKGGCITTAALFKQQNGHKSFCRALPGAAGKARIRHRLAPGPAAAQPRWQTHLPRSPEESTELSERNPSGFLSCFSLTAQQHPCKVITAKENDGRLQCCPNALQRGWGSRSCFSAGVMVRDGEDGHRDG